MAVFVIPDTTGTDASVVITKAFFMQAYNCVLRNAEENACSAELPLYMLIDEAPNIGAIPDLELLLALTGKHKIYTVLVFQSADQLASLYPDAAETIKGNIGYAVTMFDRCQCNVHCAGYTIIDKQAILSNELGARQLNR